MCNEIQPWQPENWPCRRRPSTLGDLAHDQGQLEAAAEDYGLALQLNPQLLAAAVRRSRVLSQLECPGEAIELLEEVVARPPQHVDALAQLALLLATPNNPALRDPSRAVTLAESACRLTKRTSPPALRALAAAHAAAGQDDAAIDAAEESLVIARVKQDDSLVAEVERELASYRAISDSNNDRQ